MREPLSLPSDPLSRVRTIGLVRNLSAYIAGLSLGDRLIAYALGALVVIACVVSMVALEHRLMVIEPAYGGTLVEGDVGSPRFVNPLLALSDSDRDMTALTYAGLMAEDASGNLVPALAESYTVSADGKTYTFKLRPDAKFSDGTAVTADDVVFTVEKAQDPALKSPEYANWSGVAVRAVDPETVEFVLAKPYAPFIQDTTLGILPAHLWQGVSDDEFAFSNLNVRPVGAGPFVVTSMTRDSSGIIDEYDLSANKTYVLGRPYLSGMRLIFYSEESDLAAALLNGSVESAYDLPGSAAVSGTTVDEAPYSRVFGVFFNPQSNSLFAHKEVREALSIAIDRDDIVDNVLGGYATAINGPVPPGTGVDAIPLPAVATRISDAATVLENAGWVYDSADRVWRLPKTGETLTVTLKTSNVPELKATASAIQEDWQQLGVSTDVELYEPGDLTQNVIRPRAYDALLFGMVVGNDRDLYAFWDSKETQDPGLNIAMYSNPDVDALLEKARAESDPTAVTADLNQINQDVAADYPAAFTHSPDFVYFVPKSLHGVVLPQITAPSDRFAGVTQWYMSQQYVWPFLANSK